MEDKETAIANALNLADTTINEAKALLLENGQTLDFEEWVTIKKYATLFNIPNTQIVTNWIARGIIPSENIKVIKDLNNLRLIKAIPYKGLTTDFD